jgi:hypothetical protein
MMSEAVVAKVYRGRFDYQLEKNEKHILELLQDALLQQDGSRRR